jgi:hypothetical protein
MRTFDAWILRRLLIGQTLDRELDAVSRSFAALARHLSTLEVAARVVAWNGFLASREDRDQLIQALAEVDPLGPAPSPDTDDDEAADDWGPIRLGTLPPAEPFPLDVLPLPARDLAEAAAGSIGCPVDFPAVATLAAASGLLGRSASMLVKPGYFVSASLYVSLVGGPSSGKSPALRAALAPVWRISQSLYDEWRPEMDAWEEADPKD